MTIAYAALWFFVFTLPWDAIIVIPGIGVITKLTGAIALGFALMSVVVSGRVRRWSSFHVAAFLFVIWTGAITIFVYNPPVIPKKFWTFAQLFLVLWMMWELAPTRFRVIGLMVAYVFGAYVAAADTILVFREQTAATMSRFAAENFDANDLAMTLVLGLPMAWYLGMHLRHATLRWLCRGYVPVGIFAIGLTGSRGGMLTTMVALLIVPLSMTRLTPARMASAIAMLAISGALAVAYVPETVIERLSTTGTEFEDASLGGRFKLWVAGMQAFTRRPVIGYGASAFKPAVAPFLVTPPQVAHNSYISVLVEEGLVGFLLYGLMVAAVFLAVLNLPRAERRFALVLLATLMVAIAPLTWEDRKATWFVLGTLLGLAQAYAPALAPQPGRFPLPQWASPPARAPRPVRPVGPLSPRRQADSNLQP